MPDHSADAITVYSDYVCPFCYLGHHTLGRFLTDREDPPAVEWHPFDLRADRRDPDGTLPADATGGHDESYFEQARENVERLQAEYGVEMSQAMARDVDSRNAQLASLSVQSSDPEAWPEFDDAVFDALWLDGRDIGDPDVLADVASDVGLDPGAVRDATTDSEVEAAFQEHCQAARARGVRGVPTFVYGERSLSGAVPPARFERLLAD